MALVIVTKIGVIRLPAFTRNFIDVDVLKDSINEIYSKYPFFARLFLKYITKIIKDAYIVIGNINHLRDIKPIIRKMEKIEGKELSDDDICKIIKQTKEIIK